MVLRNFDFDFEGIDDVTLLNTFAIFFCTFSFQLGAGEEYSFCNQPTQDIAKQKINKIHAIRVNKLVGILILKEKGGDVIMFGTLASSLKF